MCPPETTARPLGRLTALLLAAGLVLGSGLAAFAAGSPPSADADLEPVALGFDIKPAEDEGMPSAEIAGAPGARFSHWNDLPVASGSASLTSVVDSRGAFVGGVSVSLSSGDAGGVFSRKVPAPLNDTRLFASLLDKFDGKPGTITVTGIPYPTYDLYFYMADDGPRRGGAFTVGSTTYYLRGGVGTPASDGFGYGLSTDTTLSPGANTQGHYVKFTGLSGPLTATFTAVDQGDGVRRLKLAGFQIVGRAPKASLPAAPGQPTLSAVGPNSYTLVWAPVDGATAYLVFRSSGTVFDFTRPLATVPGTRFTHTDSTAAAGATYRYVVCATNAAGVGPASAPVGNPPPNLDSAAFTSSVVWPGSTTTLRWSVPNADSVTIDDGVNGPRRRPASGSLEIKPSANATYTFRATNPQGENTKRLDLAVVPRRDTRDAVWQWSVTLPDCVSPETKDHPRAFLYVPPGVSRVRGVVIGQHNMLEEPILEHVAVRRALADAGMAAIWITPAFDRNFNFTANPLVPKIFQTMMDDLAAASGYAELSRTPVVWIGHSAMAETPYFFAAWDAQNSAATGAPRRAAAAISVKGWYPGKHDNTTPAYADSDLADVPLLYVEGELADANGRAAGALSFRNKTPGVILSFFADTEAGHFDWNDKMCSYIGLYLRKLGQYRLPADAAPDGTARLLAVNTGRDGWLVDRWRKGQTPSVEPAPVSAYAGKAAEAFWYFDEAIARATQSAYLPVRPKTQLLAFTRDGQILPQRETHMQVESPVVPDPAGDGLTFKLGAAFLDTVPAVSSRLSNWSGLPVGSPIGHADGGGPILLERICGPVEQLSPDTFRIRFDRVGTENIYGQNRSRDICLMAVHPGDTTYQRAVQQALFRISFPLTTGADQVIDFPAIPDQRAGATSLALRATTTGTTVHPGSKVDFYVLEGPARVDGERLVFTPIPPRAKFPVKVTVVATQYGRSIPPLLKTAAPVSRTFYLNK